MSEKLFNEMTVLELLDERAKWQAKVDTATGWGAAYGQALEWIEEIDRELRSRRTGLPS